MAFMRAFASRAWLTSCDKAGEDWAACSSEIAKWRRVDMGSLTWQLAHYQVAAWLVLGLQQVVAVKA